jgi:hypothetical protein
MLKIAANPFFWTEAKLQVPDENGQMAEASIKVKLRYKDAEGYQATLETATQEPRGHGDEYVARAVLIEWTEVVGEQGEAVPYSPDARDSLFRQYKPLPTAIVRAWIAGQTGAAQGN